MSEDIKQDAILMQQQQPPAPPLSSIAVDPIGQNFTLVCSRTFSDFTERHHVFDIEIVVKTRKGPASYFAPVQLLIKSSEVFARKLEASIQTRIIRLEESFFGMPEAAQIFLQVTIPSPCLRPVDTTNCCKLAAFSLVYRCRHVHSQCQEVFKNDMAVIEPTELQQLYEFLTQNTAFQSTWLFHTIQEYIIHHFTVEQLTTLRVPADIHRNVLLERLRVDSANSDSRSEVKIKESWSPPIATSLSSSASLSSNTLPTIPSSCPFTEGREPIPAIGFFKVAIPPSSILTLPHSEQRLPSGSSSPVTAQNRKHLTSSPPARPTSSVSLPTSEEAVKCEIDSEPTDDEDVDVGTNDPFAGSAQNDDRAMHEQYKNEIHLNAKEAKRGLYFLDIMRYNIQKDIADVDFSSISQSYPSLKVAIAAVARHIFKEVIPKDARLKMSGNTKSISGHTTLTDENVIAIRNYIQEVLPITESQFSTKKIDRLIRDTGSFLFSHERVAVKKRRSHKNYEADGAWRPDPRVRNYLKTQPPLARKRQSIEPGSPQF